MSPTTKTELLKTLRREVSKTHIEFDGQSRPKKVYHAKADASDGEDCFVIEYIYHAGLDKIRGRKEGYSVWSSSFEQVLVNLTDDLSNFLADDLGNDLLGVL